MRFKTLPASKDIDARDLQDEKHSDGRTSTIEGITIEVNADEQNAFDSILVKSESGSKSTSLREKQ
jgi:hypothetical protein